MSDETRHDAPEDPTAVPAADGAMPVRAAGASPAAPDSPPAEAAARATPAESAEPAAAEAPTADAPAPRPAGALRTWRDAIAERPEPIREIPRARLVAQSRRDFLLFGAGALATGVVAWWLMPDGAKSRLLPKPAHDRLDTLAARVGLSREARERTLNRALTFDDDVAEALYSKDRRVRTYARSDRTPLRNNYHGRTPGPEILPGWTLELTGLASGRAERLTLAELRQRFPHREQVTRLICVEGWSAIAWWGGLRFADLLAAYPPAPGARWAALRSEVSLDGRGRPEPYYVSLDLGTALHPQTLLATEHDGRPLTMAHGAPLRLLTPVKLGLKNIKALTHVAYTDREPADYWHERGYSKYDGL